MTPREAEAAHAVSTLGARGMVLIKLHCHRDNSPLDNLLVSVSEALFLWKRIASAPASPGVCGGFTSWCISQSRRRCREPSGCQVPVRGSWELLNLNGGVGCVDAQCASYHVTAQTEPLRPAQRLPPCSAAHPCVPSRCACGILCIPLSCCKLLPELRRL